MLILLAFLPLISFGIGILIGYSMKPEDVIKEPEDVYAPGPKPEKELPKWDRRQQ